MMMVRHRSTTLVPKWLLVMNIFLALLVVMTSASKTTAPTTTAPTTTTTTFVESPATFATTPEDAMNDMRNGMMLPPLKVAFWTTPNRDWSSMVEGRLKAVVARLSESKWVMFHPHQALTDRDGTCLVKGDVAELTTECQSECVNAGRYCAIADTSNDLLLTEEEEREVTTHAGLTGADIVTESARRLCIWKDYFEKDIFKWFDYLATLRETKCDMSLSDNCLNRVYETTGISASKIADCFHANGGVGPQIDSRNDMLEEELVRSLHIPNLNSSSELPQLAINGVAYYNLTSLSDWQLTASICNWFPFPKPPICDFCLMECPHGNDDHDPTRQCLWDLTCGDERTLQDWMQGTGPVFSQRINNSTNTSTTTSSSTSAPSSHKNATSVTITIIEDTDTVVPTSSPNMAPTPDVALPELHTAITSNFTEALANMTSLLEDETNTTESNDTSVVPVPLHPNNNKPSNHAKPSVAPMPSLAPQPTPGLPPYMGNMIAPPPIQASAMGNKTNNNHKSPHPQAGGTLTHAPVAQKATKTTNPSHAVGGLFVAVLVLATLVGAVAMYRRWAHGKEIYSTVVLSADRAEGGLASTASHATDNDLHLHVEMGAGNVMRRGKFGSNGYAPPASETQGTWS